MVRSAFAPPATVTNSVRLDSPPPAGAGFSPAMLAGIDASTRYFPPVTPARSATTVPSGPVVADAVAPEGSVMVTGIPATPDSMAGS
jgi:hypothetical protein